MNNFFEIIIIILLSGISLLAFFTAVILLLPGPIEKTQRKLEEAGGKSILLGLVNFVFFGLLTGICIWIVEKNEGVIAGFLVFFIGLILLTISALTILGLVALANLLGSRLGSETTPFKNTLRGGGLLLLAGLAPYIGWFVFTPLAVWAGLGAAIFTFVHKRKDVSSADETA